MADFNIIEFLKEKHVDFTHKMTEYKYNVCQALIKEHKNVDISIEEIKKAIDDYVKEGKENKIDIPEILDDINKIIEDDKDIPKSDWELYKEWRSNNALWNVNNDGEKTTLNKCMANIIGFIENFPKTKQKIRFNNIRNYVEFDGRHVVDSDIHYVINLINKYFIKDFSNMRMVKDAMDNVSFKHKYNPWVEYLDNLKYEDDGVDYIDYTIKNVLCCEEQEKYYDLYYETLKIMLLANISRIYNKEKYNKPTKYDVVVALCGQNGGSGKTTFFERLYDIDNNGNSYCYVVAGDNFQPKERDFIEMSHQCVCLFLDEVSMKRAIVTSVKGYITQQTDNFRKAYGYNNEPHMRGFIITASSNNDDILKDYTTDNERRWAIIKISENTTNYENVNKAFDNGYRDKLWTYIKHIYDTEDFKLYMTDEKLIELEKEIQRGYKASNNEDYTTIVNDLLEREYGFYDDSYVDVDAIVAQYKYGNSKEWCLAHNKEYNEKLKKYYDDKYTMKPEDREIKWWGKIDKIQKTILYEILRKVGLDFTNKSLAAEMRVSGIWNGYDNKPCKINGKAIKAYWRKEPVKRSSFIGSIVNEQINNDNDNKNDNEENGLPF